MLIRWGGLASLVVLVLSSLAEAGVGVSIGVFAPIGHGCRPGPCYPRPYPYAIYRPYMPYYVAPPPVYYYEPVPVPIYLEAARVATPPPPVASYAPLAPVPAVPAAPPPIAPAPPLPPLPTLPAPREENLPQPIARAGYTVTTSLDLNSALANVRHPDEKIRLDAVQALGRFNASSAIDALNATLARDPIPGVRDAAARGLGAIGKPGGLNALRTAAGSDPDGEVRRSAAYSAEVIQATLRGR